MMLNQAQRQPLTANPFNAWYGKLAIAAGLLLVVVVMVLATLGGDSDMGHTPATAPVAAQNGEAAQTKLLAALAEADRPTTTTGGNLTGGWTTTALTVTASLGAVVVIIYGTIGALRRFMGPQVEGRSLLRPQDKLVSIKEITPLSAKHVLYLVRAGDKLILLGATEQQISYLADLDGVTPEKVAFAETLGPMEAAAAMPPAPTVAALLHKARSKVAALTGQTAGNVQSVEHRI